MGIIVREYFSPEPADSELSLFLPNVVGAHNAHCSGKNDVEESKSVIKLRACACKMRSGRNRRKNSRRPVAPQSYLAATVVESMRLQLPRYLAVPLEEPVVKAFTIKRHLSVFIEYAHT
ncbi:hypothetical protein J6590_104778 [Homalodisca vitripennis]|nr:hypothetical protein J6590_104778 [Homalodisca vitripennis]